VHYHSRVPSGQYVAYTCYRIDPAWRRLPVDERSAGKDAFAEIVETWAERMDGLRAYTCTGVRSDCDFFLWKITERYADLGELGTERNATPRPRTRTSRRPEPPSTRARAGRGGSRRTTSRTSSSTRS
jgi:chlorite dismutase